MEVIIAFGAILGLAVLSGGWTYARTRPQRARLGADGVQDVSIIVRRRYRPAAIVVRCGVPLRLKFVRDEDSPCSQTVIFPDFGISRSLPAHRTTAIELTPDRAGEFLFTCEMGMYQGILIVTPKRGPLARRPTVGNRSR